MSVPHTQMLLLLYYYFELCVCECVSTGACVCVFCYYVELCLILRLVMCLSYRYGRRSTPQHNYLALQKSPCPQGKTERRETVMLLAVGRDQRGDVVFKQNKTKKQRERLTVAQLCNRLRGNYTCVS